MTKIVDDLLFKLDRAAQSKSDFERMNAESKSLRQPGNTEGRKDLYLWPRPDQTLEGQASDYIKCIKEALEEAMRRYPDSHSGLAFFAAASGLLAETPEEIYLAWAKDSINKKNLDPVEG